MKRKLLALVFLLAFAITPFLAFGAQSASATIDITTPGTTVNGPCDAVTGAVTAFTAITGAGVDTPLTLNGITC
jgi:ABC-type glycerol-3-phosphate transport system substrate-binding protein